VTRIRAATTAAAVLLTLCAAGASSAAPGKGARGAKAATAAAALPPAPRGKNLPADKLDKLRAQLFEGDAGASAEAARELGESGAANATAPLYDLLAGGTAPERAAPALDALGKLADAHAIEVLALYAGNRRPDLRRLAVRGLGAIADGRVVPTLLDRLGDSAPDVRAAAAEALASRKERRATARLLMLVKRNDPGAAGPLGQLATPDMIPALAELQGSIDDGVLATALGEYVKRDEVADQLRVDVLSTINKLPGAAATTALVEYLASIPAHADRPSKKEAQRMVEARSKVQ
jgi:HEAT repeat protein